MQSAANSSRTEVLYTREDIEALIADGRHIFIYDERIIKADAWLDYHPGGDIAIKHMLGRDATDEVNAYVESPALISIGKKLIPSTACIRKRQWRGLRSIRLVDLMALGPILSRQYKVATSERRKTLRPRKWTTYLPVIPR